MNRLLLAFQYRRETTRTGICLGDIFIDGHSFVFVIVVPVRFAVSQKLKGKRSVKTAFHKSFRYSVPIRNAVKRKQMKIVSPRNMSVTRAYSEIVI